ncbi:MAG: VCBS repeat-containing protein [Planctomycetes bacterium]|nr:VCBS repeat-containing protein [Planctomycetota bacterium]MCB9884590.1 VCBS repeat-containing protein [Planctomycetota bacterium]
MNLLRGVVGFTAVGVVANAGACQGGPNFGPPSILQAVFMVGPDVAAQDLNGDGVVDIVQANPGFALGTNFVSFRAKLLERDGASFADVSGATPAGPPSLAASARIATGDFDEDGFADVASMTLSLALGVARNSGQSATVSGFGASTLIDDLTRVFTVPWPVVLHLPVFEVADFDADGHLDMLLGPVLADHLNQSITSPGMFLYFGRGDGTFEPAVQMTVPSAPVDADWVDWDADGTCETLIVLGQVAPNATSHASDLTRYRFTNRVVQQVGPTQPTGTSMFVTSLAHAVGGPMMGGQHAYFLTGHGVPVNWIMQPELSVLEVDAQGTVLATNAVTLPASVATVLAGDLQAAHVADFDGDGHLDLVALHAQRALAPGELVWVMGPFDALGSNAGIHVTSLGVFADTRNAPPSNGPGFQPNWQPNLSSPKAITVTDLDLDQMPDLLIGSLMTVTASATQMVSATMHNQAQTSSGPGRGHVRVVGPARPTPSALLPRCGTGGGSPVLGNADFAITLSDAPRDALVGLMAGIVPATFTHLGLSFVFVPEQYGALTWLHSPTEGASRTSYSLPVPNDAGLIGMVAYFQWLTYDVNANDPYPLYNSSALEIEFGLSQ